MKPNGYAVTRNCLSCGQPFGITSSRNRYCVPCRTLACAGCGESFIHTPGDARTTCSPECSRTAHGAPTLTCQHCGAPFPRRGGHTTKHCSQRCRYLASRKDEETTARGERRGWRYKQWRSTVLDRDQRTCQRCGTHDLLTAHHVLAWETNPELRYDVGNGIALCADCHGVHHGMRLPRRPRKFPTTCPKCGRATKGRAPTCKSCSMKRAISLRKLRLQTEAAQPL